MKREEREGEEWRGLSGWGVRPVCGLLAEKRELCKLSDNGDTAAPVDSGRVREGETALLQVPP